MTWLALLLIGIGVADLGHSIRPVKVIPETVGAIVAVLVGLCCDLTGTGDLIALVAIAAVVIAWGRTVRIGFGADRAWLPLVMLGSALVLALLVSPLAGSGSGIVGDWLVETPVPILEGLQTDRALLVLGVMLVQMSTGNV